MRQQGLNYFNSWNIVDFSLFVCFIFIKLMRVFNVGDDAIFMPELKLILLILAFMKLLFFVRIFE